MYVLLFIVEVLVDISRVFLSLPLNHLVRLAWWKIAAQDFPYPGPEGGRDSRPGEFLQVLQVDGRVPGEKSLRWETLFTETFLSRGVYNHCPPIIWRITSLGFAKRPHKKRKV